jgi:hypothetical protein
MIQLNRRFSPLFLPQAPANSFLRVGPRWGFGCGPSFANTRDLYEAMSGKYKVLIPISLLILIEG